MKGEGNGVVGSKEKNEFEKSERIEILGSEIIVEKKRNGKGIKLLFGQINEKEQELYNRV